MEAPKRVIRPADVVHLQAEGAYPAGSRVVKQNSEPGDGNPDGALGVVRGSMAGPMPGSVLFYFIEWDKFPDVAVGTLCYKVALTPRSSASEST